VPSVHLTFTAPDVENLTTLKIYEAASPTGTFSPIETVSPMGVYPDYIDEYTTDKALNTGDWFAIEFIDSKGATTGLSVAVKGDQQLAISEIIQRVTERDASLNERVVQQEAESAIYYATATDPYDPTLSFNYLQKRGITNLTLAFCYLSEMAQSVGASWTAGIVSMKFSDAAIKARADSINRLIAQANRDLGTSFSMVAYLEDLPIAGGSQFGLVDQTRLLVEFR